MASKPSTKTPRVVVARCGSTAALGEQGTCDLVVATDDAEATGEALAAWLRVVHAALTPDGALCVMVSSEAARALLLHARALGAASSSSVHAFGKALAWAKGQRDEALAPALSPERLLRFAEHAAAAELDLLEPDITDLVPALVPLREHLRSGVDRAVMTTIALGQTSRALVFARRGPATKKAGQLRVDRITSFWVRARGARGPDARDAEGLIAAAFEVLENETSEAIAFKELLRASRERARSARGGRPTVSSDDGPALARALATGWLEGRVELFAVPPEDAVSS